MVGYPHDIKGQGIYAYVTLMAGEQPSEELRKELVALGAQGDRPDRLARPDPVRARPAEDPLRQDHAPHPAQDRRGRVRQSRRHLDARRSGVVDDLVNNRQNKKAARSASGHGAVVATIVTRSRQLAYFGFRASARSLYDARALSTDEHRIVPSVGSVAGNRYGRVT